MVPQQARSPVSRMAQAKCQPVAMLVNAPDGAFDSRPQQVIPLSFWRMAQLCHSPALTAL